MPWFSGRLVVGGGFVFGDFGSQGPVLCRCDNVKIIQVAEFGRRSSNVSLFIGHGDGASGAAASSWAKSSS